ncbi:hypothetical protein [Vibrio viridaestus]|uniref:hypothetical protein n=1 Tax=Vibrio viridaestus TaxID=2487322 RepID=UPI000F608A3C|nr:hypothetical protein [Vibrio viridaestus]
MKIRPILYLSASVGLVVCISLLILSFIYDFNYDFSALCRHLIHSEDAISFLFINFLLYFCGTVVLLWGFFKTNVTRKLMACGIYLVAVLGFYIWTYFDSLYFDYVVQNNPYDGYFVQDIVNDNENRTELKKANPQFFADTIASTSLMVDKYKATLYGNKSEIAHHYNICMNNAEITFVAIDLLPDETADYCQPVKLDTDRPTQFTLKSLGHDRFVCEGCDDHLLPQYWKHVD